MEFIISLLIFGVITTGTVVQSNYTELEVKQSTTPIKESLLLTLERTPCFGKCPTYTYSIFTTGKVIYNGKQNVKNIGTYKAQLSMAQLEEIKSHIESFELFKLKDKYDAQITDIPSTILVINIDGRKKKIYDRYGAPKELTQFEKLVDDIVLNSAMTKTKDQDDGNRD